MSCGSRQARKTASVRQIKQLQICDVVIIIVVALSGRSIRRRGVWFDPRSTLLPSTGANSAGDGRWITQKNDPRGLRPPAATSSSSTAAAFPAPSMSIFLLGIKFILI